MINFEQKHAIITGGSSGIGKALAKKLVQRGAHVSLIARTVSTLNTAKSEIMAEKINSVQQVITATADVADAEQITTAIQNVSNQVGVPDLLVTSAGMAYPGYFEELPLEIFTQTMAVNYFGALYSIKAVLPLMKPRHQGQIVLISSGAGLVGIYGYSAYSPSKFALRGLAESLRGELKKAGIGMSIVYPPDTDTPQLVAENRTKPPETKRITETAKLWQPEDVAQVILRGIEKQQFSITPGLEMTLLARVHSLLSEGIHGYLDRLSLGK